MRSGLLSNSKSCDAACCSALSPASRQPQKHSQQKNLIKTFRLVHQPVCTKRVVRPHKSRLRGVQTNAVFDYCQTSNTNIVESTLRSWRAVGLLLLRQAVDQENRAAAIRAIICLTYLIEINLWVVIMVALPAMVQDPAIAFAAAQTGTLLAVGTAGSTVGKGLAAAIMDKVEPRMGMIAVLILVAAFNSGFALGNSMPWFCFFWFTGRIVHSSGWVAATRLICSWTEEDMRGAALGGLSFAARMGFMVGGAGLGQLLLLGYSWRFMFHAVSAASVVMAAVLLFAIPSQMPYSITPEDDSPPNRSYCLTVPRDNRPKVGAMEGKGRVMQADTAWGRSQGQSSQQAAEQEGQLASEGAAASTSSGPSGGPSTATSQAEALRDFSKDPQVWAGILGRCLLHLVFEFQAFLTLFVQQVLKVSAGLAAQIAAGYSLGSAVTVLMGGYLYCRLMPAGRRNLVVALCIAQAVGFWGLLTFSSTYAVIGLILLLGGAMSIPYYVPGPAYNLRRGGNYSAVLEGLTEMAAFGLAVVFDLAVSKVLPTAGWPGVLRLLLACAVGGTVVMAIFMQQEKHYEENLANL